jgi:hypothetical protein
MRSMLRVAGLAVALSAFGCGGTVDEGPVQFKPTDSKQFEDMKNQMIGNMKNKSYTKNKADAAAPKAGDAAPAEKSK